MRIVSMFALCLALSACTEEEVVTVLEPVAFEAVDGGSVAPTVTTTSSVVAAESEEQAPVPVPAVVTTPSDASAGQ